MYIPTTDDLKLVPIKDLINELKTRHDAGMLLAFMVDDPSFPNRSWELVFDGHLPNINLLKDYVNRACDEEINLRFYGPEDE